MGNYKIKDLETLSGIKAHTIRIWEKRYGIIEPSRTNTQIRTYTDDDLKKLLNVALLNKSGIKISRIADMTPEQVQEQVLNLSHSESENTYQEELLMALLDLNESQFVSVLNDLVDKHGLKYVFQETLLPFLDRIGVMWMVGSIDPAQEHFVSNLIRQKLLVEIDKLPVPNNYVNMVLLFLPEHELHEFNLLYAHYVLRSEGISSLYLGQSLPLDALKNCIERIKPKALVTSWITSIDEYFILAYFKELGEYSKDLPIYGKGEQFRVHQQILKGKVTYLDDMSVLKELIS